MYKSTWKTGSKTTYLELIPEDILTYSTGLLLGQTHPHSWSNFKQRLADFVFLSAVESSELTLGAIQF